MIHFVICCRQFDKSVSGDNSFLIAIFNVLGWLQTTHLTSGGAVQIVSNRFARSNEGRITFFFGGGGGQAGHANPMAGAAPLKSGWCRD